MIAFSVSFVFRCRGQMKRETQKHSELRFAPDGRRTKLNRSGEVELPLAVIGLGSADEPTLLGSGPAGEATKPNLKSIVRSRR